MRGKRGRQGQRRCDNNSGLEKSGRTVYGQKAQRMKYDSILIPSDLNYNYNITLCIKIDRPWNLPEKDNRLLYSVIL